MMKDIIWAQRKTVIYTMLAGTIGGLTAVALFAQSGLLISKAALMPPFYTILILAAFLKLFGVAKSSSKYAERLLSHRVTFHLMSRVRERYFEQLLQQTSLFYRYRSGHLLSRITSDVETLQHYFLRVAYPPLVAGLVFLATMLFTLIFSWQIALMLMLGYILSAFVIPYLLAKRTASPSVKEALASKTTELLYGYETLQHFHQLDQANAQLLALSDAYAREQLQENKRLQQAALLNQCVALATAMLVLLIGAVLVTDGSLQGVYLAMLLMIALTVFEMTTPLAATPHYMQATNEATARLQELTSNAPACATIASVTPIEFSNVTFQYPGALSPAVRNVSLTIAQGEKVAIFGTSGSGKTSLLQLLLKELPLTDGHLTVGGVPLHEVADDSLFTQLGVQLQFNHFFIGTIQDNLRLAKPDATPAEMEAVLRYVQLPLTLDDVLQEKALNLSGGERQRLAYARVLLQNAPCLLLDEPFANVDAALRDKLMTDLCQRDQTVLIITHDEEALALFDRVYRMEGGRLQQVEKNV